MALYLNAFNTVLLLKMGLIRFSPLPSAQLLQLLVYPLSLLHTFDIVEPGQ